MWKTGEELSHLKCTHASYDYEGDRLISYNGENCAYNNLGNPTEYRGKEVEWQYGTRLTKLGATTFAYDGLGRRIRKNGLQFLYDSENNLIYQSKGLEFIYDTTGVAGLKYNDSVYFYRKDAQGNIIAILDSNGAVVVKYNYDAWGRHNITDADGEPIMDADHIAYLNPFRYRSYYYDTETRLYYLQTRYYDPETGRFISQDDVDYAEPEVINGINLYAYCGNNPVMRVDYTGCGWNEFWEGVGNFFKNIGNAIRDFFVYDVYEAIIKPIGNWLNDAFKPASDFFNKTVPDFFYNTVWKDWIVDKFWNKGVVPVWNWINGDNWYQIIIKNILMSVLTTGIGALIGGPAGALIGFGSGVSVGIIWDILDLLSKSQSGVKNA